MAWTPEQQKAIDTRDRTLLVSAAAGSGKTATLTERIIQSILDEDNPADIGRMLIATYTNAAVDELRERIGRAIKRAARENPQNVRLEEQLLRLKDAKILTITSFCNSILRVSAESIGLPPNYRIAEPPEAKILSSAVLEGLINAAYEGDIPEVCTPEEFILLADCLSNVKNSEGLSEALSFIFGKLTYSEEGIDTLLPLIKEYDPEHFTTVDNTRFGKYITNTVNGTFGEYSAAYERAVKTASGEPVDERNLPKALSDLEFTRRLSLCGSYEELRSVIKGFNPERISRGRNDAVTDFYHSFKLLRSYLSDDVKKFSSSFFVYSTEEWRELYAKLYNLLGTLYKFLKKYYDVFSAEKRRRAICEFSDVERYAYLALYTEKGEITPLAQELRSGFDAVYVDEYQDVNGLQSKIFSAISKDNNRFMVGDIKQSIYCFRSARPEIFREMKEKFPSIGSEGDYPAASIFMSDNFRCDKCVVDFVNGVFDTMFGLLGESIGYVDEDKLKFSKIYPEGSSPTGHIPEIHVIEKQKRNESGDEEDAAESILREELSAARIEAAHIADKIASLIASERLADGSRIEPKDIAILMRSVKGSLASAIADALKERGIASDIAECGDLFMCEEVLLALSFLYSIDNPRKDIYLTAVMLSPLFGFSADEVLDIRKHTGADCLWDSLLAYAKDHPENGRVSKFIAALLRYRKLAEGQPTDVLLSAIYRESGLLALASRHGGAENLTLLYSYARKYESTDFKGLYSFISYINAIIGRGEEFTSASAEAEENAVRIMTVHKSKGLEFPVAFIAGASGSSGGSREGRIAFREGFGISVKTKDDSGLAIVENPAHNAINHFIARGEADEELRVLYVALTRARERLYIYATAPRTDADEYIQNMEMLRELKSPYFASKAKSFLDIVLVGRNGGKLFIDTADQSDSAEELRAAKGDASKDASDESQACPTALGAEEGEALKAELIRRFEFRYPHSYLEALPEKISVSKLTPSTLDISGDSEMSLEELLISEGLIEMTEPRAGEDEAPNAKKAPVLPSFITGSSDRESALRGIATHTVLQFCDFERLEKLGTQAELERLVEEEFISQEDGERVRTREIDAFVRSSLFREIKGAGKLYRELRFNVKLPAEDFTLDEEKKNALKGREILVQGVIDCIIEAADGTLHLVDYKTDRLTKEEREDPRLAEQRLKRAHARQLSYYSAAIKKTFGREPSRIGVYSLHLGKEIVFDKSEII